MFFVLTRIYAIPIYILMNIEFNFSTQKVCILRIVIFSYKGKIILRFLTLRTYPINVIANMFNIKKYFFLNFFPTRN